VCADIGPGTAAPIVLDDEAKAHRLKPVLLRFLASSEPAACCGTTKSWESPSQCFFVSVASKVVRLGFDAADL
jgi:hypothetical protein